MTGQQVIWAIVADIPLAEVARWSAPMWLVVLRTLPASNESPHADAPHQLAT